MSEGRKTTMQKELHFAQKADGASPQNNILNPENNINNDFLFNSQNTPQEQTSHIAGIHTQ